MINNHLTKVEAKPPAAPPAPSAKNIASTSYKTSAKVAYSSDIKHKDKDNAPKLLASSKLPVKQQQPAKNAQTRVESGSKSTNNRVTSDNSVNNNSKLSKTNNEKAENQETVHLNQ